MANGQNTIDGDLYVRGTLRTGLFAPPANSVGNTNITSADPIIASKLYRRLSPLVAQTKTSGASVAERRVCHVGYGAGNVVAIRAGVQQALVGGATTTIDLYKNGVSVLSATVVLDNTDTAYGLRSGTIASAPYVAGDVFEVVITVAAGGGTLGQGLWVQPVFEEAP